MLHTFPFQATYAVTIPCEQDTSEASLVEIGPRFVLKLIRIFEGSFGGPTLFQVTYRSPCILSVCVLHVRTGWLNGSNFFPVM